MMNCCANNEHCFAEVVMMRLLFVLRLLCKGCCAETVMLKDCHAERLSWRDCHAERFTDCHGEIVMLGCCTEIAMLRLSC